MPASERLPEVGLSAGAEPAAEPAADPAADIAALTHGELTVRGRVQDASNAVLYCECAHQGRTVACVYKPVSGERPLWDFPDGTLAEREVAAYLVSEATGWGLVPPTVLRDGPYGQGMVQLWIDSAGDEEGALLALTEDREPAPGWKRVAEAQLEEGRTALLVHADDMRLRRIAVLDAVINNADRKGGHLLPAAGGRLYGIDHGVTFHTDDKLRTLLWGWAGEPLPDEAGPVLERIAADLRGPLGDRLAELLTEAETAALRERVDRLRETGRHPSPGGGWPAIPWPPV
jgi:uncharacterized repeat protein (TIGR03843 family)